jgi:hypothetical protein
MNNLATQVLSTLLGFINDELSPNDFSKAETDLLKKIRSNLGEFERFVKNLL